jgi:putative transposase
MPRRQQIYLPGGTYYIVRRTYLPRPVFLQPGDYALIERLLPAALKRTDTRLLGYCWMPDAIHLALQIAATPVGSFMRQLTSRYAQYIHRSSGERGQFFRRRYQSTLVDPNAYLKLLIHYLHYIPVLAGAVQDPVNYPHSSHRAYLGREHGLRVHTKPLLQLIDSFDENRSAYRRLTAEAPRVTIGTLFERGQADTPGVVGDPEFIARLPRGVRVFRSALTLDEITAHVARTHDVVRAHVLSKSRRRELVIARARIAWYATERRVANLSQVARYLRHSASSLTRAVTRHQVSHPELFSLEAFASLIPFAPMVVPNSITDSGSAEGYRVSGSR